MDKTTLRNEERDKIVYEFDGFRLDPVRRLLSRDGEPVQITPKALSILVALLEQPGKVLDKRELIDKVWPGTCVTEANLAQNVFSLRKSLGERANENRYVITVSGQGYSFRAEVQRLDRLPTAEIPIWVDPPEAAGPEGGPEGQASLVAEPAPTLDDTRSGAPAPPPNDPQQTLEDTLVRQARKLAATAAPAPSRRGSLLAVAGMLVAVVALGAGLFELLHLVGGARNRGAKRPAIAVLDLKCVSPRDDALWLQTALTEMLTTELASSGSMRVIQGDVVAQTLQSLGIQDSTQPGPADLKRLHDVLGVDLIVVGSYVPLGDKIRLNLRVLEVPDGCTVASVPQDGTQPQLFDLIARAGTELRRQLKIDPPSPQQIQEARAQAPSNPAAQRPYAEGLARLHSYDAPGALPLLQRAAAADPSSAVIHSALAQALTELGYDSQAKAEARRALDLAGPLPPAKRLAIEGRLYRASKQWDQASEAYRSLWTFYPDEIENGLLLVNSLTFGGRAEEAAQAIAELRQLPPPAGLDPRIDLAEAANAGRLTDFVSQIRAARTAEAKGRRSGQLVVVAEALTFRGGALEKMGSVHEAIPAFRESAALMERAGYLWGVGRAKANLGRSLMRVGDLDGAQKAWEEALAVARRTGSAIGMVWQLTYLGWLARDRGHFAEAFSLLDQARESSVRMGDRFLEAQALNNSGEVLLTMGDLARAQQRFERAAALSQAIGNRAAEAKARANLGAVLAFQGELAQARRWHQESADVLSQTGDASAAASASAAAAEMAGRLGDLGEAWQQSSQALAAKRRSGDRIGVGRILGSHAWLAYQRGDFVAARQLAGEQLQIVRETGARSLLAWGLHNRGRAELAAGELAAARASLTQALAESTAHGEALRAMEVRLDLARLDLATGQTREAEALALAAAAWFRARGIRCRQSLGSALLAEAMAREGRLPEARAAAAVARERLDDIKDRPIHNAIVASLARCGKAIGAPPPLVRIPAT